MTKIYLNKNLGKARNLFLTGFMLFAGMSYAQLSGTYTIDAGAKASSTNYQDFASLASDLAKGTRSDGGTVNGPDIGGAVIVNVVAKSGPYKEQVVFSALKGSSKSNTITINGNGNTLEFTATSSTLSGTVVLDGADFMTIDNLVIRALSSSIARGVHLKNSADYNTISNCTVEMPNMTSTSNANFYIGMTNGTSSTQTYADPGEFNTITKNTCTAASGRGPYSGIVVMNESSGTTEHPNTISDNVISDYYYYGIWTYYAFKQTITGNEIFLTGARSGLRYGMYNYCYNKGGDYTITDNYIHDIYSTSTTYGIYHYAYYGTGAGDLIVERNKVVLTGLTTSAYGIYLYGYRNTISGDYSCSYNYIDMEKTGGSNSYIYGIYGYGAYYQTSFVSAKIDNNEVKINTNSYVYGIMAYIYYNSNLKTRGSISNNIVDAKCDLNMQAGIYAYCYGNNQKIDVNYNTVISGPQSNTTATKYLMYMYYVDGLVHNNNLYEENDGGTVYGFYDYYGTADYSNNNLYTASAGSNYSPGAKNGSAVTDIDQYRKDFGDNNGMEIDPKFRDVPKRDYHPTSFNFVNKGIPVKGFDKDFAGVTRNTTNPDVGALEYYVDVATTKNYLTGTNVCGGYQEVVKMDMANNTSDDVVNVPVFFSMTGKAPVREVIPSIKANSTTTYTFKTIAEFNGSGTSDFVVGLDGTDDNTSNNSLGKKLNITPSPAGFKLIESATFPGYYRPGGGGGTMSNPDAAIPGKKVIYEIEPNTSTGYTNSNYGNSSKWVISATKFITANGTTVSGPVYNPPGSGTNATLEFDPSSSYTDSLIYLQLFVKDNSTGCDSTFGRWIYVPHIPVADFEVADVCVGEVATFTNKSTLGKGTPQYKWKFNDPGTPEDSSTLIDPIFNFSTFGVYDVVMSAYNAQYPKFIVQATKKITVTPVPSIDFKVLNACEKVPVQFKNNTTLPIPGTITYDWDFGDPLSTTDRSTSKEPTYTYKDAGGYKVRLRATANGCTSELIKNSNQYATPKAAWSAPSLICDKSEVPFSNKSIIKFGNMGYTWDFGDGGISNFANPMHIFSDASDKTVKMKAVSEFGCVDSSTMTISLSESPKADFTWGAACNLTPTDFQFTGTRPASPILTTFNWDFDGAGTTTLENPSQKFDIIGGKAVTLTLVSNNGCSDKITKNINVKLQSKADFEINDVCEDDDAVFTNTSSVSAGNLNYNWKFGDGTNSAKQSPRHRYNINSSQTFNVTLVAVVPGGCSDSITKAVSVNESPDADFTYTTSGRLVYFDAAEKGATLYQWRFGDGGSATNATPSWNYLNFPTGNYTACLAVVNAAGCFSETCKTIAISGSVNNITKLTGVKVYPNPNKGNFTVTVEDPKSDISIAVYNLLGEVVKTIDANALTSEYAVNLNVANGVYLVKVTNGGLVATHKVTVNK